MAHQLKVRSFFASCKTFFKKHAVVTVASVVVLALFGMLTLSQAEDVDVSTAADVLPVVELLSVNEYAGGKSLSLVGSVRALTEATVTSEETGQVTSVPVSLGASIRAGQIIATLENASEQAAVLQAEGVYEAALAAAAQSNVGVNESQTNLQNAREIAWSTYQDAYTVVDSAVRNTLDTFFVDPQRSIPGLLIDGGTLSNTLNNERVAYQTILSNWQAESQSVLPTDDITADLQYASEIIARTTAFVDLFITALSNQDSYTRYTESEIFALRTEVTNVRSQLISAQASVDSAESRLANAKDAVLRAELTATGGTTSAADAQIKQALGSLRAAQANLAKTILRSPINGTINALPVRVGDFVSTNQVVAQVANNNTLEIVTAVSDTERTDIAIGDTVVVDNSYDGTVTQIAPAIDPVTRKIEVRIATEGETLQNGETVRISKDIATTTVTTLRVPLTAVKFNADAGVVFIVNDNNVLESVSVTTGLVTDGAVEILDGLSPNQLFVRDARGLQAGTKVIVTE